MLPLLYGLVTAITQATINHAKAADNFESGLAAYRSGDYGLAKAELHPLAKSGDAKAQTLLGHMYSTGRGVSQDSRAAAEWYRKAALQGHMTAQFNLGNFYAQGVGVKHDPALAVYWFEAAAMQGDRDAQNNLAYIFANGWGQPVDFVKAYVWWARAAAAGSTRAGTSRDAVAERMTPAQLIEAKRLLEAGTAATKARKAAVEVPVPSAKPGTSRSKTQTTSASGLREATKVDPGPSAGFQVQLGYFRDRAKAEFLKKRLVARHPNTLSAEDLAIIANETGNKEVFYRVVAQYFISRDAAQSRCRRYRQAGVDCFVRRDTRRRPVVVQPGK